MRTQGVTSRILSGVAGVLCVSAAQAEFPRFKVIETPWPECLKAESIDADGYYTDSASWILTCPRDVFLEKVHKEKIHHPGLNLLIGRVLHQEVNRVRNEVLQESLTKAKPQDTSLLDSPLFEVFNDLWKATQVTLTPPPQRAPFESTEGTIVARTQELVSAAETKLTPLLIGGEGKTPPPGVLALDAGLEYYNLLGDSLRFGAAVDFVTQNASLFQGPTAQREIMSSALKWDDMFGASTLRPWLAQKLEGMRTKDIAANVRPEQLQYWLKSLEIAGAPTREDKAARETLVAKLRELWLSYPQPADAFRIRAAADKLGVSSEFMGPGTRDMTLPELIVRAKAQVGQMDTAGAVRTLRRVTTLPRKDLTGDDFWTALQLHVRVLRISDERHLIPGVLQNYIRLGKLLELSPRAKPEEVTTFLNHAIDIVRLSWSYDTSTKTMEFINRFLKVASTFSGQDSAYAQLLYLKARVVEQERDLKATKVAFEEALAKKLPSDLLTDLLWRNLSLHFDLVHAGEAPAVLLPLFDPLKKVLADDFDKSRWHYWRGQALLLNSGPEGSKDAITAEFEKSYKTEPYSFYSNLAGLELIKMEEKPRDWELGSGGSYEEPRWSKFFSDKGTPEHVVYADMARVYFLATIGDLAGATNAARQMDGPLWDRLLSSKSVVKDKRRYARAVAWLRLAIQDSMGSLKVAEIARRTPGIEFESEDFLYLYPLPYWENIQAEAKTRGVDPWLAASLIRQESAFNPRAKSIANALGLMQMIPAVAKEEAKALDIENFQIEQLYQPPVALKLGVFHLSRRLRELDGSWIGATAAYNAGLPPVQKWLKNYDTRSPIAFIERMSFVETRNYVRAILRNYMNYRRIYGQGNFELQPIVKMPGSSLVSAR